MGVERKDYIMLAVDIKDRDIDFYDDKNEKFLPYIEGHKDCEFSIIDDAMCEKYCFFGKVLKTAEDYDGLNIEPIDISFDYVSNLKEDICKEYYKLFETILPYNAIKLYCFTNWY